MTTTGTPSGEPTRTGVVNGVEVPQYMMPLFAKVREGLNDFRGTLEKNEKKNEKKNRSLVKRLKKLDRRVLRVKFRFYASVFCATALFTLFGLIAYSLLLNQAEFLHGKETEKQHSVVRRSAFFVRPQHVSFDSLENVSKQFSLRSTPHTFRICPKKTGRYRFDVSVLDSLVFKDERPREDLKKGPSKLCLFAGVARHSEIDDLEADRRFASTRPEPSFQVSANLTFARATTKYCGPGESELVGSASFDAFLWTLTGNRGGHEGHNTVCYALGVGVRHAFDSSRPQEEWNKIESDGWIDSRRMSFSFSASLLP